MHFMYSPKRNPGRLALPGFHYRLVVLILSVQPFAEVIGDYACHNGKYKLE